MAHWGEGEYIILLNSDTRVSERWSELLLGYLQCNTEVAAVGYGGGLLDENGVGGKNTVGPDIDFVNGWCLCFSRKTYQEFGLFSHELQFAYGEDADFSLRLKEAGRGVYALATPLVYHHGNKTISQVAAEKKMDLKTSFEQNHDYIRRRWADYLKTQRVLSR
jgi:GT2 family glycosyltransferase